jgi:hypothetical protein
MRRPALRPRTILLGLVLGASATLACDEYLTDLDPSQLVPATLTRFAVAPDSLDLSVDDAAVVAQVSARAGAGIDSVRVALAGPLGGEAGCAAGAPVAGTVEEGAWECALEIGPGAPLGMWAIARVTLHHGASVVELTGEELADAGFASTVRVARTRTLPIPALVSLTFTPERVDVTSGAASLEVLAGLAEPADSLDIDLAGERHQASCTAYRGAEESLAYGCAMDVPADAAPDEWRVERVRLFGVDTTVVVGPDDLESLDLPTAVAVVIDRTDLMSLTLDRDTVQLPDTVGIRVEVAVRNSARAVDSLGVSLTGPGQGNVACLAVESSAAFRDLSAWDCTLALPDGAAGGTWSADEVRVHLTGRAPDVFAADTLRALGFAIDVVVLDAADLTDATIVAPADGSAFAAGDTVVFQGTGRDRAGAELTGAALAWASSRDGELGSGVTVSRADLSVGSHTVTLTATGPAGEVATAEITLEVTTPVQPPVAAIQSPADGAAFLEGASIIFQGTGTSGTGDPITGTDLVWTSSRDGQIGTGQSFARADLSVGSHTITLRATDPATGLAAQAGVTIMVEDDDAPPPPDDIRWVAVGGTNQQIATSPDGVTWTARSSPFTMTGRGVAYNGARWVAVGQAEYMIATSDDGITWTGRASPFTTAGRGATWFHDQWVAVGQGGARIATSPDGETWTARAAPITGIAYGIAASDTLLIVGGQTGATLATSTDGVTWTARSNPITGRVMGVAWNGALWVAVGETGARIITSPDGVLWTSRTAPFTRVNGVAWNGELWVAVGQGNATIATSVNGLTWTAQPGSPFTTEANGVAWDGNQWVVVGFGGARLATSTDGINWTPRDTPFSGQVWGVASSIPLYPPPGNAVDEPVPTSVTISGAGPVARGETRQLTATIYDQHRRPMEDVEFEWRTTRPCRVTVDQDGVVTGRSVGASTVSAWVSASVRASVSISVPAVSGEPPESLTGVWEACDDWDGTHLLTLDLTHEAGAESVTGTVTEIASGTVRNISFGRWLNEVLEVQWSVFVQGGERTSFIAGGTALDPYVLSGTYNDRIRLTTHDVRLIRVDD